MYDQQFRERLIQLRTGKNVSAREMSLSIGQNVGYINNIENGKSMPAMESFFNICDFLEVTPAEFFDTRIESPRLIGRINAYLEHLDKNSLEDLADLLERNVRQEKQKKW